MTARIWPNVRPEPEPGDPESTYKRHLNAILDALDHAGRPLTNAELDERLGWRPGTAGEWTWRLIVHGDLVTAGRAGRRKLYQPKRPLSEGGP